MLDPTWRRLTLQEFQNLLEQIVDEVAASDTPMVILNDAGEDYLVVLPYASYKDLIDDQGTVD